MKRIVCTIMVLFLFCSAAHASGVSMREAQDYIFSHSAADSGPFMPSVEVSGTILSITNVTTNHYDMLIAVKDNNARASIYHDQPLLVAHFRLHVEDVPFSVGDDVTVYGEINMQYSSPLIPFIQVIRVNDLSQDDF